MGCERRLTQTLEIAILFTLWRGCKECYVKMKCISEEEWRNLDYDDIICKLDTPECIDFYMPLDVPWHGNIEDKIQFLKELNYCSLYEILF